jgi:hypothetical protein
VDAHYGSALSELKVPWIVGLALNRPRRFIIQALLVLVPSPTMILQTPTDTQLSHPPVVSSLDHGKGCKRPTGGLTIKPLLTSRGVHPHQHTRALMLLDWRNEHQ